MALPNSGPITMAMIAAEIGISASGLSLNDSRVRQLAGKPSGTISFSDLLGKSATWKGSITVGQIADPTYGYSYAFEAGALSPVVFEGITIYDMIQYDEKGSGNGDILVSSSNNALFRSLVRSIVIDGKVATNTNTSYQTFERFSGITKGYLMKRRGQTLPVEIIKR